MTGQRRDDIHRFLHPTGVAIVGGINRAATPEATRARYDPLYGAGNWSLVSPRGGTVGDIEVYTTLADVPAPIELAVLSTPPAACAEVVAECGALGVSFALVFSSGFREVGPDGAELERQLTEAGRRHGVRIMGPNTNTDAFEEQPEIPGHRHGRIGLVTQSGHNGRPIVEGSSLGIAFSRQVPCGNEADLDVCDFIEYYADDPDTAVVAGYIEGFRDVSRLRRALAACHERGKPVVILKIGSTAAGSRMAASHTGHLTGSDDIIDGLFCQYGVTRVRDLDELLETAALFARIPADTGPNVALYSISGGSGTLMAEQAELAGVPIPRLADDTQTKLHELIPSYLTVANPIDNGGTFVMTRPTEERQHVLDLVMADPSVDVLVVGITGAMGSMSDPVCDDLAVIAERGTPKPVIVTWNSPKIDERGYPLLIGSQLPMFRSFRNCFTALARFEESRAARLGPTPAPPEVEAPSRDATRALDGAPSGPLDADRTTHLLDAYDVPLVREVLAGSAEEAAKAAADIGFPVVMKLASPDFPHKSDVGLVRLGVGDPTDVAATYAELVSRATELDPDARVDGVMVQETIGDGVEMIVGITRDPVLGPAVLVGTGGIFTEILADVAVRPLPIDEAEARRMVAGLRGRALLDGARGRPPADVDALVEVVMRTARLGLTLGVRLAELDLNPVMVRTEGAVVVDALAVLD